MVDKFKEAYWRLSELLEEEVITMEIIILGADVAEQIVRTEIRLLMNEQSVQALQCLLVF